MSCECAASFHSSPKPCLQRFHLPGFQFANAAAITLLLVFLARTASAQEAPKREKEFRGITSLTNASVKFQRPREHYVTLKRAGVEAVIVDNAAIDAGTIAGHKAGYSGVASLTHMRRRENLFVPNYAGLNFEYILDGTRQPQDIVYEPRREPMELRQIDADTAELYQRPTKHWGVESCLRYAMLEDGAIELTIECIPRRATFKHDYLGIFFASYIHQPESLDIHFRGQAESAQIPGAGTKAQWIRGVTPKHGVLPTHRAIDDNRDFAHDEPFPMTLVYNFSKHRYRQPWYFGVSHGMAFVQIFRPRDKVRITQSPSGGGGGNPAWDFQAFFEHAKIGEPQQMVMRAVYLPFESAEQVAAATKKHRAALGIED